MDEGDGRVSQSGDDVVSVSGIPDLVRSGAPVEIEEQRGLRGNLPTRYLGARWGEKVGMEFGRHAKAGLISGGGQISLWPARQRWWHMRVGSRGRQASLCKHVVLIVERQLVIHLQTQHQKKDIEFIIVGGGSKQQTRTGELGLGARVPMGEKGGGEGLSPEVRGGEL